MTLTDLLADAKVTVRAGLGTSLSRGAVSGWLSVMTSGAAAVGLGRMITPGRTDVLRVGVSI